MKLFTIIFLTCSAHDINFFQEAVAKEYPPGGREAHVDKWPADITNIGRLFQTMDDHNEQITLKYTGRVPVWLRGNFYRNGPGKYEFGNDTFAHFFDPSAIVQRLEIRNSEIKYNSKYIETRNYLGNKAANAILYPEVGTWAEDFYVTHNEDGSPIEDEAVIEANRCKYLVSHGPTDNADVSIIPVHGWLLAMTETALVHLLDPHTLETVHSVNLADAPGKPEFLQILTLTAHGHVDDDGDYWNMGSAMDYSGAMPMVAYFTYKIPNAGRTPEDMWVDPIDPTKFLDMIEFSMSFAHNSNPMDFSARYFHMFSGTKDFLVVPLNSVAIEMDAFFDACRYAKPLVEGMNYREERKGEFRIFSKKDFKFIDQVWDSSAFLQVHMIQAFENADNGNLIHLDTITAGSGESIKEFYYTSVNKTGQDLIDQYNKLLPVGTSYRYTFDLSEVTEGPRHIHVDADHLMGIDSDWLAYGNGGMDFPVVNYATHYGKPYDHFWSSGFGTVMPDRIYHTEISTETRWVWREEGYSPSEPSFVAHPMPTNEDDGVILSLCSPMSTERPDLKYVNEA